MNKFLGRAEDGPSKLEVIDNVVCKKITANEVKVWPNKGILISSDVACKRESPLTLHCRILDGTHATYIAATPGQIISDTKTRKETTADLMGLLPVGSLSGKRENEDVLVRII
jgi:hypothetical protein